ncbi:MAG TPA: alpha/beta hydrolase [Acidimicrobiales bacterium]|nr:alpha/beta hydrolase [Acidimicrobiales bacterium]
MAYADVNGQRIYYEDSGGDGPPVILAHGFLMDHEMFAPQVEALAPEFRVITWDERGFGATEFDGKPFTYWDSASDCLGLLTHLGIDEAVVGGMSQGGFLSMRAALTSPERVKALVLLDTQSGKEPADVIEAYRGMQHMWLTAGPVDELVGPIAELIIADPDENPKWIAKWKATAKESFLEPSNTLFERDDITDRVAEITCPAFIAHGTADTAISMESAKELRDALPNCVMFVEVEGGAHAANLTHPDQVNPPLLEFLRKYA